MSTNNLNIDNYQNLSAEKAERIFDIRTYTFQVLSSLMTLVLIISLNTTKGQIPELWGTASSGGMGNNGSLFKINGDGSGYTNLYDLTTLGGFRPECKFALFNNNGKLYGTTYWGGIFDYGVIFSFDTLTNTYSDLFDFNDSTGANPTGTLLLASDNKFYGMTFRGGGSNNLNYSVLYSFDPSSNNYSVVHYFTDTIAGATGHLFQANNGLIYGQYQYAGTFHHGFIFTYNPMTTAYNEIYNFDSTVLSNLIGTPGFIQGINNLLYQTGLGGQNDYGSIFSIDPITNTFQNVYTIYDMAIGQYPTGILCQASNGLLYGLTSRGGINNLGVIFSYDIFSNTYIDLYNFNVPTGIGPQGGLIQASDGKLYGTTDQGGAHQRGVVFSFDITTNIYTDIHDFDITDGSAPVSDLIEFICPLNSLSKSNDSTICSGNSITLHSHGAANYVWNPLNITDSVVTVSPTASSIYLVTGYSGNCVKTDTIRVTVNPAPTVNITGDSSFCLGGSTTLSVGTFNNYLWNNGETTSSITINNIGTYTITVTGTNGCTGFASQAVTVNPSPTPIITGVSSICIGDSSLLDVGTYPHYLWSTGSSTEAITVNTTNTYIVTVTNGFGCTGTATKTVTVHPQAHSSFTATDTVGCSPLSVDFINASSNAISYLWNFGNNDTSIVTNPTFDYTTSGIYTISLIAYGAGGCNDTMIHSNYITIDTLPVITSSFTAVPLSGCNPLSVSFNNTSTNGTYHIWHFGDSTTDTTNNPIHTYNDSGTFTVKLYSIDSAFCGVVVDSSTTTITVYPQATASFTADTLTGCSPFTVHFINNSSDATSYLWNLGNNNTSTATNPSYTYNTSGSYTITLIAYSIGGCNDTMIQTNYITINTLPTVSSSFVSDTLSGCNPLTVTFTNTGSNGTSYLWNFGDSSTLATMNAIHTYTDSGTFTITLIATNNSPCGVVKDTFIQQNLIRIDEPIKVTSNFLAEPLTGCSPLVVNFTNSSINGVSYYWYFGDGGFDSIKNPIHIFDSGSYHVYLIAYNTTNRCINAPDSTGLLITVENCELSIPNTFTPNGDGKNDFFDIIADGYTKFNLIVFDRWGLKIFESSNASNQWNGKVNNTGGECADGTYYYIFSANDSGGSPLIDKGFISLIR